MDRENRYSSGRPQVWPVIAVYGIVVLGVAAYSVFKPISRYIKARR
jgi:hypothetical protein